MLKLKPLLYFSWRQSTNEQSTNFHTYALVVNLQTQRQTNVVCAVHRVCRKTLAIATHTAFVCSLLLIQSNWLVNVIRVANVENYA